MSIMIKSSDGFKTIQDFERVINNLSLQGKDVLVYSRLFNFGRLTGVKSVTSIIDILKLAVGKTGSLIIPTYTLGVYNQPRIFSETDSKIMSGVLGEFSTKDSEFIRMIHPIYSNSIYNDVDNYYEKQRKETCFGDSSFFDLYSKRKNGIVLMLGLNFNGPSLYHYYDQTFKAKGRFLKSFDVLMEYGDKKYNLNFDSYVKDYNFYSDIKNCLGRFDAISQLLGITKTVFFGDGYIHKISEPDFKKLFKITLEVDQGYFLTSSTDDWIEYYTKNNYRHFYGSLDENKINEVKKLWNSNKKYSI